MANYRRDEMKADAADRGWMLKDLFRVAEIARTRGYDFMAGRTASPRVAEALTRALGKPQGFYQVRKRVVA